MYQSKGQYSYHQHNNSIWVRSAPLTHEHSETIATVSFLQIETSEIPQLKALTSVSSSSSYTDEL